MTESFPKIKSVMRKKALTESALNFVSGCFGLLGSLIVLGITYWLFFMLGYAFINPWFRQSVDTWTYFALAAVSATFIINVFLPEAYHSNLTAWTSDVTDVSSSVSRVFSAIVRAMCTGPKLFTYCASVLAKSFRLALADVDSVSRVVEFVLPRQHRVPLDEIIRKVSVPNIGRTFNSLGDFDGVLFAGTDPVGLSLTEDFRGAFNVEFPSKAAKSGWIDPTETARIEFEPEPLMDALRRESPGHLALGTIGFLFAFMGHFVGGTITCFFMIFFRYLIGFSTRYSVHVHRFGNVSIDELIVALIVFPLIGGLIAAFTIPTYQYPWNRRLIPKTRGE
jgi:hypothetical protein